MSTLQATSVLPCCLGKAMAATPGRPPELSLTAASTRLARPGSAVASEMLKLDM